MRLNSSQAGFCKELSGEGSDDIKSAADVVVLFSRSLYFTVEKHNKHQLMMRRGHNRPERNGEKHSGQVKPNMTFKRKSS